MEVNTIRDGKPIAAIPIPRSVLRPIDEKRAWGEETIVRYVRDQFDITDQFKLYPSTAQGQLTGTGLVATKEKKRYNFMLVEPKRTHGIEVLIFLALEDLASGSLIEHKNGIVDDYAYKDYPDSLPANLELRTHEFMKKGKRIVELRPCHMANDPLNGDLPSLRFFEPNKSVSLIPDTTYRVKLLNYRKTGLRNAFDVDIFQFTVELLG